MRFISALLCFCLTFNVMAASGTVSEFERALDEYQYSLTVQWDQKDAAFMTARTESFYATIATLMTQGLTKEKILDVVSSKSNNIKEVETLKLRMDALASASNSSSELAEAITTNSTGLYATGASWEGSAVLISVGIVAVLGAAIAYSIWFDAKHTCVETAQGQQCGWVSPYYGAPVSQQIYQCWNAPYCTRYERN